MSYEMTVDTPISCAEMAEVQLMNMSSRTAAAPPLPMMVCAAKRKLCKYLMWRKGYPGHTIRKYETSARLCSSHAPRISREGRGVLQGYRHKAHRSSQCKRHGIPRDATKDIAGNGGCGIGGNSLSGI